MKKFIGILLCLTMLVSVAAFCLPAAAEEFPTLLPVSVSGYGGKTVDVDPRYPGIVYTFDEPLDPLYLPKLKYEIKGITAYSYDDETLTLTLFPDPSFNRPGTSFTIPETVTSVSNTAQNKTVVLTAVTRTLADRVPDDYTNMIPYGDNENGYQPLYSFDRSLDADHTATENDNGVHNTFYEARTYVKGLAWPHSYCYAVTYEEGATYKVSARIKSLGTYPSDADGGNLLFDAVFGGIASGDFSGAGSTAYPAGATGEDVEYYKEHICELSVSREWQSFSREFRVDKLVHDKDFGIAVYSNPASGEITQYAIDDLSLYKRIDLTYISGTFCRLADNQTEPAAVGAYLDGTGTTVTVGEMPFEPLDGRWSIDTEKPWIDTAENHAYAVGDVIDLAVTGSLVLMPNLVTEEETFTVTFKGDRVDELPRPVKVFAGETLDLSAYENISSAVPGMNFNGWSTTGNFSDILHDSVTVTGDMTLYADVSHSFDFAIAANNEGWTVNHGVVAEKQYNGLCLRTEHTSALTDTFIERRDLSVPMAKYKAIRVLFDAEYAQEDKGENPFSVEKPIEGIYFSSYGENASPKRRVGGTINESVCGGKYVSVTFPMYLHEAWEGPLDLFRLDPNVADGKGFAIRSIEFIEAEPVSDAVFNVTVSEPQAGFTPGSEYKYASNIAGIRTRVAWVPVEFSDNRFHEHKNYTIYVHILPPRQSAFYFTGVTEATINGNPANVEYNEDFGSVTLSYTFPPTAAYEPFEMKILGADNVEFGTTQAYTASFSNNAVEQSVFWTVSDESCATISTEGVLTPLKSGTITVIAVSAYNPAVKAEKTVVISGRLGSITYHAGTQSPVGNLPEKQPANGKTALSAEVPTRDGYMFLGWALSDETLETVTTVEVPHNTNVDVYAVWGRIAFSWEFNSEKEIAAFGGSGGLNTHYYDGCMYFETESPGDPMVHIRDLSLDSRNSTVIVGVRSNIANQVDIFVLRVNGMTEDYPWKPVNILESYSRKGTYPASSDTYNVVIDMKSGGNPGWVGTVTGLRFDFVRNHFVSKTGIDYIRFIEAAQTITFDANTTDYVFGMPEAITVNRGDICTVAGAPIRHGYRFVGWSKSPDASTAVKKTFGIVDNTTLYAIWEKSTETSTLTEATPRTETVIVKTAESATFTITPHNISSGSSVLLALYRNGRIVDFCSMTYDGEPLTALSDADYDEAKVYVCENLRTCKPLCVPESLK